ncbi:hypothetical protein M569_07103, partial [Genlisea aurea]
LDGRTTILADSMSLNSMNLQQCSSKKVFLDFSPNGTYCVLSDLKAVQDVGSNGGMDQWGLRHHKEALIDHLDQVEDVISAEQSSCSTNPSMLDSQACSNGASDGNLENHEHLKKTHSSCLVLEVVNDFNHGFFFHTICIDLVSEKHVEGEPMCGHSSSKVLRLLDEQSGSELVSHLQDEWYFTTVAPGDTVHLIGEFDEQGRCDVNHQENFIIVHPDILVSSTRVSASFSCPRRTVLDMRLKHSEYSYAALMGTLLHQIFQAALISESPSKEFLEDYAIMACLRSLESLFACGVNENEVCKTLIESIPKILKWITSFRDPQNSTSPSIGFKSGEESKNIKISEVIDIEEMVWAPKYGMKGMIDASVRVVTGANSADTCETIMPLEFKTGKGNPMEHNAQVVLYTLLMSERYMTNIDHGLLYYLHTDITHGISVKRSDVVGLIMRRNELANDLLKASIAQQLPPLLQAHGGSAEGSGLGDDYESFISHLKTAHTCFLHKWERLIDLEAKHLEVVKKGNWYSDTSKNDEHPSYLSSMILDNSDQCEKLHSRGNRFVYRFVRSEQPLIEKKQKTDKSSRASPSYLECMFKIGDYVV